MTTTGTYHATTRAGATSAPLFSVVTLVASQARYDRLRASFEAYGFDAERAEFIALDNSAGNVTDGYTALYDVAEEIRGRYVLLTHDDIELMSDGFERLADIVEQLDAADPRWMIAGNAGATADHKLARHIDDPTLSARIGADPVEVVSLDENFLVMPADRLPFPSLDLSGFHLFATDMCLQARSRGGSAYVVPFLLHHHSAGTADANYQAAARTLETKWSARGMTGLLRTPTSFLYFGRLRPLVAAARLTWRGLRALRAIIRTMLPSRRIPFETREQL